MGKYFKLFETHAEYEAYIAQRDKTLPNISYCLDYEESHFNPLPAETRVIATFNVATTSAPTKILNNTSSFTKVEIDDIEKVSIETGHTFDTTGEHEVKYTLSDPTSIGAGAFTSCSALENVKIPKGVETIDENAFMACTSLDSVLIPNSVTSIGNSAFNGCSDLTSVIIPEKVTSIGSNAFNGCSSLSTIKSLSENAPTISSNTFEGVSQQGMLFIPDANNSYNTWLGTSPYYLNFYENHWDKQAFGSKITAKISTHYPGQSVKILSNPNAFSEVEVDSTVLTEIVTDYKFYTTGVHTITYTLKSSTVIPENTFSGAGIYNFSIPYGVTEIGDRAFYNTGINPIIIPDTVTSIGVAAFCGCSSATRLTISSGVTSIKDNTFNGCSGFSSLTISENVTEIGNRAFFGCSGLVITRLGSNVKNIGEEAFAYNTPNDSSLRYFICYPKVAPTISNTTFKYIREAGTLTVPSDSTGYEVWMGTGDYYLGKYNWNDNIQYVSDEGL